MKSNNSFRKGYPPQTNPKMPGRTGTKAKGTAHCWFNEHLNVFIFRGEIDCNTKFFV